MPLYLANFYDNEILPPVCILEKARGKSNLLLSHELDPQIDSPLAIFESSNKYPDLKGRITSLKERWSEGTLKPEGVIVKTYVGIDVSKSTLDVAALHPSGEIKRVQIKNTGLGHESLVTWLGELDNHQIILEATGSYHQKLVVFLQAQSKAVSIVNPRQSNDYAKSLNRRNKTDAVDALILARYGRERQPQMDTASRSVQQSLAREIEALSQDLARLKNRLEAATHGLTHPEIKASLQRRIKALEQEKKELEKQLEVVNP